jgi:hypothetical protein
MNRFIGQSPGADLQIRTALQKVSGTITQYSTLTLLNAPCTNSMSRCVLSLLSCVVFSNLAPTTHKDSPLYPLVACLSLRHDLVEPSPRVHISRICLSLLSEHPVPIRCNGNISVSTAKESTCFNKPLTSNGFACHNTLERIIHYRVMWKCLENLNTVSLGNQWQTAEVHVCVSRWFVLIFWLAPLASVPTEMAVGTNSNTRMWKHLKRSSTPCNEPVIFRVVNITGAVVTKCLQMATSCVG